MRDLTPELPELPSPCPDTDRRATADMLRPRPAERELAPAGAEGRRVSDYGTTTGQFGAVAPLLSAQLMRP